MKLIVFDIDGTLTDSVESHIQSFISALRNMGVENINDDFKSYKHHTDSYIAKIIYEKGTNAVFSEEKMAIFEHLLLEGIIKRPFSEIAGAQTLLTQLAKNKDYAFCFATGSLFQPAVLKLNSLNVNFNKLQLVTSNDIEERDNIVKKAIEQALTFYSIEKFEQIISVGDGLWDLKTAQNLNIDFIGIGNENKQTMLDQGMKLHFQDLTEMLSIFEF